MKSKKAEVESESDSFDVIEDIQEVETQTEEVRDLTNVRNIIKYGMVGIPLEIDGIPYRLSLAQHDYRYPIEKI